jgi:hypothetical protein
MVNKFKGGSWKGRWSYGLFFFPFIPLPHSLTLSLSLSLSPRLSLSLSNLFRQLWRSRGETIKVYAHSPLFFLGLCGRAHGSRTPSALCLSVCVCVCYVCAMCVLCVCCVCAVCLLCACCVRVRAHRLLAYGKSKE